MPSPKTVVLVRLNEVALSVKIPFRVYSVKGKRAELTHSGSIDEVDPEGRERIMEALRRGDLEAFRKTVTEAVAKWIESRGGKLVAAVVDKGDMEFYVETPNQT
ncbi:MAG: hypothetical protein QW420_04880 [Candidatus Caldarchaeum sp.]